MFVERVFTINYTYANYIWQNFIFVRTDRTDMMSWHCIFRLHEEMNFDNNQPNETYGQKNHYKSFVKINLI
jgi:hypothetical protein